MNNQRKRQDGLITGLAILTATHEQGKDYLDIFVSLLGSCIAASKTQFVSSNDIQKMVFNKYGIKIPLNTIKMILHRVEKRGLIKLEGRAYIPIKDELDKLNYDKTIDDVIREQNAVIEKFVKYSKDRWNKAISKRDAEEVLIKYIESNNIDLLECALGNRKIELFEAKVLDKKTSFMVGSFIIYTFENDPEGFKYLEKIIKGLFLSYSLVFPQFDQIGRRFRKTGVYLDTPLILRALGYEGKTKEEPAKEVLSLLKKEGANLKCFKHTKNEAYNILYGCMLTMKEGRSDNFSGNVYRYLVDNGYSPSDIELELVRLEKRIEMLGIQLIDKPEPDINGKFQIDEAKLEEVLKIESKYWKDHEKQRIHDVDCLSAIYQLRKGKSSSYFEESRALFVTANSALCRAASKFFVSEGHLDNSTAAVAITDYALTSLIWLKKPVEAPNLPQKVIIARCYASIETNESLWKKYLDTVRKLEKDKEISNDDYYLLRYSHLVNSELMNITFGEDELVTEGTTQEILVRIKDDLIREEKERNKDREVTNLAEIQKERDLREAAEKKERLFQENIRRQRIETEYLVDKMSKTGSRILVLLIAISIFVLISFSILYFSFYVIEGWLKFLLTGIYVVSVLLSVWDMIFRFTIKDCLSSFEAYLKKKINAVIIKWFYPTLNEE